jgi:transposase
MTYTVAGIDVHKKVLMVVVTEAAAEELRFESRRFGTTASEREHLVAWLQDRGVQEIVMESTAQYWKPIWLDLEPHFHPLHLAQAHSNRAPKGRKHDFGDAQRLTRRLIAGELILSFVPDSEQRGWRTITRAKVQLVRDRVRLQNQLEALLEETRVKLSSVISELMLKLFLERLDVLDRQSQQLDQMAAAAMQPYEEAVIRLAEAPGFGPDSAQQTIAEVGAQAQSFDSAAQFASWAGLCPGRQESAEHNHSSRSPKGNKFLRRILTQAAQAAVNKKGSHFQIAFRRWIPKLGYQAAIWAIAHKLARVVWKILHDRVHYLERGQESDPAVQRRRANKMVQALRRMGYKVEIPSLNPQPAQG